MLSRAALIVSGGSGSRFGSETPKQYHLTSTGKTVLEESVERFRNHKLIDTVCVVIGRDHKVELDVLHTFGGDTRQESVKNGLRFLKKINPKYVLIHDAARPFVSSALISRVVKELEHNEAVDVGLPIVDTIKTFDGLIIPRDTIYATQTPQGFHFDLILDLHENATGEHTDDVSLYLASRGKNLAIVHGEPQNIKITYRDHLIQKVHQPLIEK